MNVLALQLRRVGEILLTTPALRALKTRFPQAEVTFVCERPFGAVLRSNPHVDTLITIDAAGGWKERLRLTATLRGRRFDLALDFEGSGLTAALAAGSGATRRIGWRARLRGVAYTDRVDPAELRRGPVALEKLALLSALGIDPRAADPRPVLEVDPRSREWAARALEGVGVASGTFLLTLAPWARSADRSWPLERYGRLLDLFAASHAFETVLLLGPGDQALADALAGHTSVPMFELSTPPTLPQMAALLDRSDLHVGNENAARHMAAALGTAALTLFASGARRRWTLAGDPLQPGLEAALPAAPAAAPGDGAPGAAAAPSITSIPAEEAHAAVLALEPYLPRLRAARATPGAEPARRRPPHGSPAGWKG